jgi:hypothetical protein
MFDAIDDECGDGRPRRLQLQAELFGRAKIDGPKRDGLLESGVADSDSGWRTDLVCAPNM